MPLNLDFTKDLKFEDDSPELEIISRSNKLAGLSDVDLEEKLETYKGHLKTLTLLKDTGKLRNHIKAIELEKLKRSKNRELAKERTCFQISNDHPQIDAMEIDHSTKSSTHTNPTPTFTTLSENIGSISKTECRKEGDDSQGIPASAFYEEMSMLNNNSRKRQPFYNLRKPSIGGACAPETLKVYKRGGLKGQTTSNCSEPLQIKGGTSATNAEVKETESCVLKPHGTAPEKRDSKEKYQGQGKRGGTLDSALILFSSDEEDGPENAYKIVVSKNLQHAHSRHLLRKNSERYDAVKIAYPSREDPDAVEIFFSDLQQLKSMDFLNDVIIDFYIKHIQETRCTNPEVKQKLHFFNTFFFKKLTEALELQTKGKTADGFTKLRKWTKGLDIFERSFLFIPVNENFHWSLLIICLEARDDKENPQISILHLDSLAESGHNTDSFIKVLKRYLESEWNHKTGSAKDPKGAKLLPDRIIGKRVPVPSQQNVFDCGLFLLHYLELFVQNPPSPFSAEKIHLLFGPNWFVPAEASNLRRTIRELIESLFAKEQQQSRETSSMPSDPEPIIME